MLQIKNLTKRYGDKVAVDDLNLHIQPGEIYGFIGHNGAGKTTAIKCVTGILRPDAGEVTIQGLSMAREPIACKQRMAYLPDNPDLYEFMSGIKYLNFIADVFGISQGDRQSRIHTYGQMFELEGDFAQPISTYSHGMKQKLALIAALLHQPRLMILDEPFTGLDPKASFLLKQEMRRMCDQGSAVFFSTHVLEVAEKLCNKIAIIRHGRLVAQGSMEQVKGNASLEAIFLELEEKA